MLACRDRRHWAGATLVLILLLLGPLASRASAHAAFLNSQPEPGARLPAGPAQIGLTFTETLNRDLSSATLLDAHSGQKIPASVLEHGSRLIVRPQVRLKRAPYRVDWHTVSTLDGHPLEGSFSFGVRTAAIGGAHSVEQGPLARGGWLRIAARAVFYATLFFFAGGVLNATLLAPRRRPERWLVPEQVRAGLNEAGVDPQQRAEQLWRRTLNAGAAALLAAVAVAMIEAADAGSGLSLHSLNAYLLTNQAGLARVGTVAALAIALLTARRWQPVSSLALALAFLAIALSGHANSADPHFLAVVTDWLHLIAASIWVGGIAQLAAAWLPQIGSASRQLRIAVIGSVLGRFGRVALPAFAFVLVSGLINALIQLGEVKELWQSSYGRVLAIKIAFVGLIALASYLHALRLRPRLLAANPHPSARVERRHWRLLGVEPWLGLGAIVAVAALVAFPLPPRQLTEADEAQAAAPCTPSCPLPAASKDQLAVAEQAGPRIVAFWLQHDRKHLSGTIRLLNLKSKPLDAAIELPGANLTDCGTGCWHFQGLSARRRIAVTIDAGDHQHIVSVPATWRLRSNQRARRLLARAQETMRSLRTLRMSESLTSGLGLTVHTRYAFAAPDRMSYRSSTGGRTVVIGNRSYQSVGGESFQRSSFGPGGFQYRQFFVWTTYGRTVRWLGEKGNRARLALFDQGTPVWFQLTIDRRSGRVLRARMILPGHFMTDSYAAFDRPLAIRAPR
jgi:copper transport protein